MNPRRSWRVFTQRDGRNISAQLQQGLPPRCPCCGDVLEAQPRSRLDRKIPLDARAHDLDCRQCRRFWLVVQHTPRSRRLVRMRRFVAAVRAAAPPAELAPPDLASPTATVAVAAATA